MKRSQLLAASVVALMVLSAYPLQQAWAQGAYSEKLNVFIAGSDALWYFSFSGVNGSSKLSAFESTSGLAWYNITAVQTTGWKSDFQLFGTKGYNLLPMPFVPSQGLFLTIGSDSFSDASAAASALNPYLLTSFVSLSNGTGIYSFYSPLSFSDVVPSTLLSFLPTSRAGFAGAISSSGFESTPSPFVILEGQKSGSGFTHGLVLGSISATALDSSNRPSILSYFGSTVTSLKASSQASSSVIQIRFLDGIVRSTDTAATVTKDSTHFTGSYTLNVPSGKQITKINATVVEAPPMLLAIRSVDVGVVRTGDNISVTIVLRNLSPSVPITKVSFSDTWWNKAAGFKFVGGNYTAPSGTIAAGSTVTPVYRLQYTGSGSGGVTIPASTVSYSYLVGGSTFNATSVLNPIRLSGVDDAVVYASATPSGGFGKPVGASQTFNLTVTNVGTLPASSVVVAGHSIPGLAAKTGGSLGGSATVSVSQSALGLLGVNLTRSYSVTYKDPSGSSLNATTNVVSDVFSHSSMRVGLPTLIASALLAPLSNQRTNLTLTFATSNPGLANITSFSARLTLPVGLGCGKVSGPGLSCSGNQLSIDYRILNISSAETSYMKYNLTSPLNYFLGPIPFQGTTSGINVTGRSNPVAVPSGVVLTKLFSPQSLFGGMTSTVSIGATNSGPLTPYNFSLVTSVDSFDSLTSSAALTKTVQSLAPGGSANFSYGVTMSQTSGNLTASAVSAHFFFGGSPFSIHGQAPIVGIYSPLSISIATSPASPQEGKNFTINFLITNPSGVSVSNVQFTLPVPSGLALSHLRSVQVSGGTLIISSSSLSPHSSVQASAVAVATSGIVVPFDKGKLSFSYSGVTVNGVVPSTKGIAVGEDVTTRYLIPTAFVLLALLLTAFYVRRKAAPSAPVPRK